MTRPGHIGSGPVWQRSRYGQKPTGSLAVAAAAAPNTPMLLVYGML